LSDLAKTKLRCLIYFILAIKSGVCKHCFGAGGQTDYAGPDVCSSFVCLEALLWVLVGRRGALSPSPEPVLCGIAYWKYTARCLLKLVISSVLIKTSSDEDGVPIRFLHQRHAWCIFSTAECRCKQNTIRSVLLGCFSIRVLFVSLRNLVFVLFYSVILCFLLWSVYCFPALSILIS